MKANYFAILGLFVLLCVSGCAKMIGNMAGSAVLQSQKEKMAKYPVPSEGFEPKKDYNINFNNAWNSIKSALVKNKIMVITSDKENQRINTDYVKGEAVPQGPGGVFGTILTKYKYEINLTNSDNKTHIEISCKLESQPLGKTETHDITDSNPKKIAQLEKWLYEQIEQEIAKQQ